MGIEDSKDLETIDDLFGQRFAEARKGRGFSQEAIVLELEKRGYPLHLTAVGKIERGQRRVTVGEAAALADALDYTLDTLIGGQGKLLSAHAVGTRERQRLSTQAHTYADAMLDIAVAADSVKLRVVDADWLDTELVNQSPAQMTTNVAMFVRSSILRKGLDDSGKYVQLLLEALRKDEEVLASNRLDNKGWREARHQRDAERQEQPNG